MRVVLDTNVIESGLAGYESARLPPARIVRARVDDAITIVTSEPLLTEVERALNEPYFLAHVPDRLRQPILSALAVEDAAIALTVHVAGIATHPEDDLVLATAASARADYLVTGDRQLLRLGSFAGVPIVSPADFLTVLERQERTGTEEPSGR